MLLGQLAQFDGRRPGAVTADQIAFQVHIVAGGDGGFVQLRFGNLTGNTQIGIHGAFRIRRQHDQTFAGNAAVAAAVHVGIDAGGGQIVDKDVAGGVVRYLAGVVAVATEVAGGDHGVAGRTAAGLFMRLGFVGQSSDQLRLTGFVHQGHQALAYLHALKEGVADLDFCIHQGVAEGINVVFFRHGGSVFRFG